MIWVCIILSILLGILAITVHIMYDILMNLNIRFQTLIIYLEDSKIIPIQSKYGK